MNEKIKQLADQARVLADEFQEQWKAGPSNEEFFQEKFAKLIVQECLAQVDKVDTMLEDDKEKTGVAWVGLAIAKHFGVEL
jgi:hypothetical protein